jgi:hypothetical protein
MFGTQKPDGKPFDMVVIVDRGSYFILDTNIINLDMDGERKCVIEAFEKAVSEGVFLPPETILVKNEKVAEYLREIASKKGISIRIESRLKAVQEVVRSMKRMGNITPPDFEQTESENKEDFQIGEFAPFFELFPESAEIKMRKISLLNDAFGLSKGTYVLVENYCIDKKCDCRKVMINVVQIDNKSKILGTIGFGWEDEKYYSEWIGNKKNGQLMVGAYLEPGGIQTNNSKHCLDLVKNSLQDSHYVDLIKERYRTFKEKL